MDDSDDAYYLYQVDDHAVDKKKPNDLNYAVDETVSSDKFGRPKGKVGGVSGSGRIERPDLSQEDIDRAKAQSDATVRVITTYSIPEDPSSKMYRFAGTGTLVCKANKDDVLSKARIVTNDHVVADNLPPLEGISTEKRAEYQISSIQVDPSVYGSGRFAEDFWKCEKLNSIDDNAKLAGKSSTRHLDCDFSFLKCTGRKESIDRKGVMFPSLPSKAKHTSVQGVGYPGSAPISRHNEIFNEHIDHQTFVQGVVTLKKGSDALHEVPTKKGMSGTTLAEKGTDLSTFQYIHSRSEDGVTGTNGAVSTKNYQFAKQYDTHVVAKMPDELKPQAVEYISNAQKEPFWM